MPEPQPLPDRQAARARHFWTQVAALDDATFTGMVTTMLAGRPSADFDHLCGALSAVADDLLLTLGLGPRPEIVISAGGLSRLIPVVLGVVDAAPPDVRDRFEVRAFRPAQPFHPDMVLRTEHGPLAAGDVRFTATPTRSGVDVDLYIPGCPGGDPADPVNDRWVSAAFLILDHLLGEYTVMTAVGNLGLHPPSHASRTAQTLDALPAIIEAATAHDPGPLDLQHYDGGGLDGQPFVGPVLTDDGALLAVIVQGPHGQPAFDADDLESYETTLSMLAVLFATNGLPAQRRLYLLLDEVVGHAPLADGLADTLPTGQSLVATPTQAMRGTAVEEVRPLIGMHVGPVDPTTMTPLSAEDPVAVAGVTWEAIIDTATGDVLVRAVGTPDGRVVTRTLSEEAAVDAALARFADADVESAGSG